MLSNRWAVLVLLFLVRMGMGFQFQAVPALAPLFMADLAVTVADVGLLIGLYHAPGIVLALPGGAIGQRFGDKAVVLLGLALMIAGGLAMALFPSWQMQIAGRLVAGIGGILLNVLMSKMVTDWFAGKEMATAMGIFVNSWPFGIAVALVVLPQFAGWGGLKFALSAVVVLLILEFVALLLLYRSPVNVSIATSARSVLPRGAALWALVTAGLIWGFYNASLGMIFGFGPLMLAERGWSVASASAATSVVLWLVAVSVPLGGFVADRIGRPNLVLFGGFVAFAVSLLVSVRVDSILPAFVILGLVSGLPAGPIMSLPAKVLAPETRAIGMGMFFTLFYLVQLSAPSVAGLIARWHGSARVTFELGALFLVVCVVGLMSFARLATAAAGDMKRPATA